MKLSESTALWEFPKSEAPAYEPRVEKLSLQPISEALGPLGLGLLSITNPSLRNSREQYSCKEHKVSVFFVWFLGPWV